MGLRVSWGNWVGLATVILITSTSCGFRIDKTGTTQGETPSTRAAGNEPTNASTAHVLGYKSLRTRIFVPHCIRCHGNSGGVNLETFASASTALSQIKRAVLIDRAMPPSGPLNDADQSLIRLWVDAGGPEEDVDSSQPSAPVIPNSPNPEVSPNPPSSGPLTRITYADVNNRIFKAQCLRCHDSTKGHPKGNVSLNTYSDVIQFIRKIEEQALISKTMPPRKPLSDDDQAFLRAWIDQGEPE